MITYSILYINIYEPGPLRETKNVILSLHEEICNHDKYLVKQGLQDCNINEVTRPLTRLERTMLQTSGRFFSIRLESNLSIPYLSSAFHVLNIYRNNLMVYNFYCPTYFYKGVRVTFNILHWIYKREELFESPKLS